MGVKESKVTYFDGSYYQGEVNSSGKEHGQGCIYYANADFLKGTFVDGDCTNASVQKKNGEGYEGQMRELRYNGKGVLTRKGEKWSGLFRGGMFIHGAISFADGSSYEGALEHGSKSGKGYLKFPDGSSYNGHFRKDKFDGTGYLLQKDGSSYRGEFRNGEYDGRGVLTKLERGKKVFEYKGTFRGGLFDGEGEVTYENKNSYLGQFRSGKKNGKGVFRYQNGDVYEGAFLDDVKQDAKCRITKANGTVYVGGVANDMYHGEGRLEKQDGEYYEGGFYDGQKHGKGVLKTSEYLYEGSFKNGEKHGRAKVNYYNQTHDIFEGSYQEGKRNGKCMLTSDRQYIQETYLNGVRDGPYLKKIKAIDAIPEYEERGQYQNDERHGPITIRKGQQSATYRFEHGTRCEEIQVRS